MATLAYFYTTYMKDEQYITVSTRAVFTPYQCCLFTQRKMSSSLLARSRNKSLDKIRDEEFSQVILGRLPFKITWKSGVKVAKI